jgi:hypothetical protein
VQALRDQRQRPSSASRLREEQRDTRRIECIADCRTYARRRIAPTKRSLGNALTFSRFQRRITNAAATGRPALSANT